MKGAGSNGPLKPHKMLDAALLRELEKLFRVLRIGRERPFAVNILSRQNRSLHNSSVFRGRGKHGDQVYLSVAYELLHIAVGMRNIERFSDLPGFLQASA